MSEKSTVYLLEIRLWLCINIGNAEPSSKLHKLYCTWSYQPWPSWRHDIEIFLFIIFLLSTEEDKKSTYKAQSDAWNSLSC